MTVSLPATVNDGLQAQNLFSLRVMLARTASTDGIIENYACFHFKRSCTITSCAGDEAISGTQVKFILPEMDKMSTEIKAGPLAILFISCVETTRNRLDNSIFQFLLSAMWPRIS